MSRARPIELPGGETIWFDTNRNGEAFTDALTSEQVELLMSVEDIDIEDFVESEITQGSAIERIRVSVGQYQMPQAIADRREKLRRERRTQPRCRRCGREGDSTKHHFVNKWILKEIEGYAAHWADRSKNCIPMCIDCHRLIHSRNKGVHSIADMLNNTEKAFAEKALSTYSEQHPRVVVLIARGDESTYETRLIRDWIEGKFILEEETSAAHESFVNRFRPVWSELKKALSTPQGAQANS